LRRIDSAMVGGVAPWPTWKSASTRTWPCLNVEANLQVGLPSMLFLWQHHGIDDVTFLNW